MIGNLIMLAVLDIFVLSLKEGRWPRLVMLLKSFVCVCVCVCFNITPPPLSSRNLVLSQTI